MAYLKRGRVMLVFIAVMMGISLLQTIVYSQSETEETTPSSPDEQSWINDILENQNNHIHARRTIVGDVDRKVEERSKGNVNFYILKDEYGGEIKVKTIESMPKEFVNRKYKVIGVVEKDDETPDPSDVYFIEIRKEELVPGVRNGEMSGSGGSNNVPLVKPQAEFSVNITTGVIPFTVNFTNQSKGKVEEVLWSFGDGSSSKENNPSHTYNIPGAFSVSLTVTNSGGADTSFKSNLITVQRSLPLFVIILGSIGVTCAVVGLGFFVWSITRKSQKQESQTQVWGGDAGFLPPLPKVNVPTEIVKDTSVPTAVVIEHGYLGVLSGDGKESARIDLHKHGDINENGEYVYTLSRSVHGDEHRTLKLPEDDNLVTRAMHAKLFVNKTTGEFKIAQFYDSNPVAIRRNKGGDVIKLKKGETPVVLEDKDVLTIGRTHLILHKT